MHSERRKSQGPVKGSGRVLFEVLAILAKRSILWKAYDLWNTLD